MTLSAFSGIFFTKNVFRIPRPIRFTQYLFDFRDFQYLYLQRRNCMVLWSKRVGILKRRVSLSFARLQRSKLLDLVKTQRRIKLSFDFCIHVLNNPIFVLEPNFIRSIFARICQISKISYIL